MSYFNHTINGEKLDLAHLEPFAFAFYIRNLNRELTIDVKFSNHCFTIDFDHMVHSPSLLIMDYKRERAYDAERYEMSRNLPDMINSLPNAAVYLTSSDRNYVYLANVKATNGFLYPMYFHLRRAQANSRRNLSMIVESAYPVPSRNEVLKGTTKISFAVLCAKIFKGERVNPHARR